MNRLSAMHYFSIAAEEHSFSAAARKLGLSTVAVAKQVAALERELGATFFQRTPPRHGLPARPQDLRNHNCLTMRSVEGTLMDLWTFRRGDQEEAVAVRGWLRASNAHRDVVIQMALMGAGVVRVLDWANRDELASGVLVPALTDWASSEAPPVNVIYRPQLRRVARARAFIDFVAALYAEVDHARPAHVQSTQRPAWLARNYGKASNAPAAPRKNPR